MSAPNHRHMRATPTTHLNFEHGRVRLARESGQQTRPNNQQRPQPESWHSHDDRKRTEHSRRYGQHRRENREEDEPDRDRSLRRQPKQHHRPAHSIKTGETYRGKKREHAIPIGHVGAQPNGANHHHPSISDAADVPQTQVLHPGSFIPPFENSSHTKRDCRSMHVRLHNQRREAEHESQFGKTTPKCNGTSSIQVIKILRLKNVQPVPSMYKRGSASRISLSTSCFKSIKVLRSTRLFVHNTLSNMPKTMIGNAVNVMLNNWYKPS